MLTVFTSSYNHGKYLKFAIDSVLNQTYTDFEYILIDDGSIDNSFEIMCSYKDTRIRKFKLTKQDNLGKVLNKSIELTSGDYWIWCPADDILYYNLIKEKIEALNKYPNEIIYCNCFNINAKGKIIGETILKHKTPIEFIRDIWTCNGIGFTGICIPINILRKIKFPEHLKHSEDFYWMIKTCLKGYNFRHLNKKLYYKRKHKDSNTSKHLEEVIKNVPNIRKGLKDKYGT